jgi:ribosome biogenesis protein Tsr3
MLNWLKKFFGISSESFDDFEQARTSDERVNYLSSQEAAAYPWATFEIVGFEEDGRVKVEFHWNQEFIKKINELGFQAETEDDTVQLFFYAAKLKPASMFFEDPEEAPIVSEEHPRLKM